MKASPEERAELDEKHADAMRAWTQGHERRLREWEEKCRRAEEALVITVLKATEGESGFDFWLQRVKHAALVSKTGGGRHPNTTGFTSAT